jgi:diaminopimelate epimerase
MTRTLRLSKHQALGNDFLVADDVALSGLDLESLASLARRLCDRRRGVGADGFLVRSEADGFDARMTLLNADGSRAEMSGNGIRCFAQALGGVGEGRTWRILTDAGPRTVAVTPTDDPATIDAVVDMGAVAPLPEPSGWGTLGCHPDRPVAHVSLGNPHSVVGVDDVAVVDLAHLGAQVPHVNLEIVEPGPEPDAITMRVHERGAGITEACGTGACASAWAAVQWGLVPASVAEVLVHMDGGTARVGVRGEAVTLSGPASRVATIEVELDAAVDIRVESSRGGGS